MAITIMLCVGYGQRMRVGMSMDKYTQRAIVCTVYCVSLQTVNSSAPFISRLAWAYIQFLIQPC